MMPIRHTLPAALLALSSLAGSPVALLAAEAGAAPAAPAAAAKAAPMVAEEPRDVVAAIYKLAVAQVRQGTSPFFDRKARAKYFSKAFDMLIAAGETRAAHDGDALIDFDPISASQDAEMKKVTLKTDAIEQGRAVVLARFLNHGQPTVVTYDLLREDGGWKVDDIRGTMGKEAWSVRDMLKSDATEPTALPGMPDAALPTKDAPIPPKKHGAAK